MPCRLSQFPTTPVTRPEEEGTVVAALVVVVDVEDEEEEPVEGGKNALVMAEAVLVVVVVDVVVADLAEPTGDLLTNDVVVFLDFDLSTFLREDDDDDEVSLAVKSFVATVSLDAVRGLLRRVVVDGVRTLAP